MYSKTELILKLHQEMMIKYNHVCYDLNEKFSAF